MGTATLTSSADVPVSEEPSVEPVAGMRLGRYELVKRIASGGMAQVWSAQQLGEFGFRRACAVKVIRPEYATSSSFRRMFLDEARLAAGIHHPNVVEVFDLGEAGPVVYQAMELVRGCTLAKLLARAGGDESSGSRHGLDTGVVCRIVADMAAGLHAAHELTDETGNALQIVHRDVSPQNILVSVDGMAKIADFGVAKAFGGSPTRPTRGSSRESSATSRPSRPRASPSTAAATSSPPHRDVGSAHRPTPLSRRGSGGHAGEGAGHARPGSARARARRPRRGGRRRAARPRARSRTAVRDGGGDERRRRGGRAGEQAAHRQQAARRSGLRGPRARSPTPAPSSASRCR